MPDEQINIPAPGQLRDLANYFTNWAGQFDEAENKLNNIYVTPGVFDAGIKLKEHVETQRTNFETNLTALSAASDELSAGIGKVAQRYDTTAAETVDVSTELSDTVTAVSNDLPGFNNYESSGKVSQHQDWED